MHKTDNRTKIIFSVRESLKALDEKQSRMDVNTVRVRRYRIVTGLCTAWSVSIPSASVCSHSTGSMVAMNLEASSTMQNITTQKRLLIWNVKNIQVYR